MTASELVYPVLGQVAAFLCFMSIPLLGMAMLHMIGKGNV